MVAMGGGPDSIVPLQVQNATKERQVLLVVLLWPESELKPLLDDLKEEFPDLEVHFFHTAWENGKAESPTIPEDLIKRTVYLATHFWLPPNPSLLPNITFIQFFSAGINYIAKHPIWTDSQIPLCSANGVHGPQISEWVIMMDLVANHHFPKLWEMQKKREWNQKAGMDVKDRVGKRVGVLGYGSIGRQVARVAKAMGSDVIAYTASARPTPQSRRDTGFIVPGTGDPEGEFPSKWYSGTSREELHEFLRQEIDLLVLGVPLTEKTKHLLSTAEFELLHKSNPRGTYIANIARGQIIDQPALVKALESGLIRGAALDVTDPEPLPADDPLWSAPNVLITPHVSGATDVYAERGLQVLRENIRRWRSGEKLVNEVDRERGY